MGLPELRKLRKVPSLRRARGSAAAWEPVPYRFFSCDGFELGLQPPQPPPTHLLKPSLPTRSEQLFGQATVDGATPLLVASQEGGRRARLHAATTLRGFSR